MRSSPKFVFPIILVACGVNLFAQEQETPGLPDQYAEVVLQVEGMI